MLVSIYLIKYLLNLFLKYYVKSELFIRKIVFEDQSQQNYQRNYQFILDLLKEFEFLH